MLKHKKWLWVLAVPLLIVVVLGGLWATNVFGWRAYRLVDAEAFVGAHLPDGATDTHFATQNTVTRVVWLRFSAPSAAAADAFLTQLGLAGEVRAGYTPFPAINPQEVNYNWWTPQTLTGIEGGYVIRGEQTVEVAVSDGDQPTVYVRAYNFRQG